MTLAKRTADPRPCVICLSGLDPSGGAGIQADIEALLQTGSHCMPVLTSLTVQDTSNVLHTRAVDADLIRWQLDTLYADMPVAAVKIGLLTDLNVLQTIATWLAEHPQIPVIADPVLKAGGGFQFENETLVSDYIRLLLPHVDILTPNTDELLRLAPASDHGAAAAALLAAGCDHVLVTGTHDDSEHVANRLYAASSQSGLARPAEPIRTWQFARLPGSFHGSGCTLAASVASFVATGHELVEAVELAQQFTWQALVQATRPGKGQFVPDRKAAGADYRDTPVNIIQPDHSAG